MSVATPGRIAYINARVLDPATGHDGPGEVLTSGEKIVDIAILYDLRWKGRQLAHIPHAKQ